MSNTWCRANKAAGQVSTWQLLLQDGDDFLIKVLHGHGGNIPQLLENLVSSLGCSSRVHVAQHAVNFIYHLTTYNST